MEKETTKRPRECYIDKWESRKNKTKQKKFSKLDNERQKCRIIKHMHDMIWDTDRKKEKERLSTDDENRCGRIFLTTLESYCPYGKLARFIWKQYNCIEQFRISLWLNGYKDDNYKNYVQFQINFPLWWHSILMTDQPIRFFLE